MKVAPGQFEFPDALSEAEAQLLSVTITKCTFMAGIKWQISVDYMACHSVRVKWR